MSAAPAPGSRDREQMLTEREERRIASITDGRRFPLAERRRMLERELDARFEAGRNKMAFDVLEFALATARALHLDSADVVDGVVAIAMATLELADKPPEWLTDARS